MNDNLPDEKEYKKYNYKLTPFKLCVLENFPFIEADFDAITNYQLLCKVVEYLNHVINNQNTVEDNFKIMADNLNTLYNYIDTLDLQDEVNNKLDEMAESGKLTEIISLYLNTKAIFGYNNINELKQANNLVNGSIVRTLGYYSVNDGGGATYKITDEESEDEYQEKLDNGLYAELIASKEVSSIVFGDPETSENDSALLQKIFNYVSDKNIHLKLRKNKIYNIGERIKINSNLYVDFNGSTFRMNDGVLSEFLYNVDNFSTQSYVVKNITLINGTFDGNNENNVTGNLTGMCVCLYNGDNFKVDNFTIKNCQRNCFNIYETSNISLTNLTFRNISTVSPASITASSCITLYNRIDNEAISRRGDNVIIENIDADNYSWGVLFFLGVNNISVKNLKATNGVLGTGIYTLPITVTECEYLTFDNIYIDTTSTVAFEINQNTKYLTANNVKITNAYQCLTFGPNTKPTSINEFIKFTNCVFEKSTSGNYFLSVNNTHHLILENCKNNESGIASSYTLIEDIVFKNCNFTINTGNMYIAQALHIYDSIINNVKFNCLETVKYHSATNLLAHIDVEIPFDLTSSESVDIDIPFKFTNWYNFLGNLCLTSYYASAPTQAYYGKYLYMISTNTGDTGTLSSSVIEELGPSYRKTVPSITARNKITLSTTSDQPLKGFIHMYN